MRRFLRATVVLVLALVAVGRVQTAALPGYGNLSGSVESATPFKAAQVFIRNTDKHVLYMVYTSAAQFRAVALFPGNYEVSASVAALRSDVQKLVVKAGDNPKVMLATTVRRRCERKTRALRSAGISATRVCAPTNFSFNSNCCLPALKSSSISAAV